MRPRILPLIFLSFLLLFFVEALEPGDHDLFRLKDDVEATWGKGTTFYDVLDISASASVQEISKALKKKSLELHPDKAKNRFVAARSTARPKKGGGKRKPGTHVSKGPSQRELQRFMKEATEKYSRLGVIAEILKNDHSRTRYNHFLKFGFPVWKGTGYFYSRYRPGLGTVLLGLFVSVGGVAHYFALTITYKNQVKHLESYRKFARKAAWGDESGIGGIPGISTPVEVPPTSDEPDPLANLNRKQRREYERQSKKDKTGNGKSNKPAPVAAVAPSTGQKRRVTAENGKVFVVDSVGDVYLEEEDEDGEVNEFLLDPADIPKPTIWDTAVVRLPIYLYRRAADPFLKDTKPIAELDGSADTEVEVAREPTPTIIIPSKATTMDMSSSQISDSGFEIVDSTGIDKEIEKGNDLAGAKKRGKKSKK